jgi:hypothetical protein
MPAEGKAARFDALAMSACGRIMLAKLSLDMNRHRV